jgi:hypothetical protein
MDPLLGWDKAFVSPSSKKETKATLTDRATFWKDNNRYENYCPKRSNRKITSAPRVVENSRRTISSLSRTETVSHVDTLESFCGVCSQSIDIWGKSHTLYCLCYL